TATIKYQSGTDLFARVARRNSGDLPWPFAAKHLKQQGKLRDFEGGSQPVFLTFCDCFFSPSGSQPRQYRAQPRIYIRPASCPLAVPEKLVAASARLRSILRTSLRRPA